MDRIKASKIIKDLPLTMDAWHLTDEDTDQWVLRLSSTCFIVHEAGEFVYVSLLFVGVSKLQEYCRPYYSGGINEIRAIYGNYANQIIAEIVAESGGGQDIDSFMIKEAANEQRQNR